MTDSQSKDESSGQAGVTSRIAVTQILARVFDKKSFFEDALDKIGAKYHLSDADRALVHAISGNVFRNLNKIDRIIMHVMKRKRPPAPKMLHHHLRAGVAQILYMEVAAHAVVHASVEATKSLHLGKQKGLVNAVLRAVQRQEDDLLQLSNKTPDNLPNWLYNNWVRHYGEKDAKRLAEASAHVAPLDITISDSHASLEWGHDLGAEPLLPNAIRVQKRAGHITSWPGYEAGAWWVQDFASSIPINMLGDVANKSVLDICAAPGGKTMQLAAKGARVTALDISASRMQRVTDNLVRTQLTYAVKTHVGDALLYKPNEPFDVVVLDAPCSSTGTLRRHPELPWIHGVEDIQACADAQAALMRHAADLTRNGGVMLYCTCSLQVEEGESQLELFLKEHNNFKEIKEVPKDLRPFVKGGVGDLGFRTYPYIMVDRGGMDGFFFALLKKQ